MNKIQSILAPKFMPIKIRARLLIIASLMVAAISIFILVFFPARQQKLAFSNLEERAESIALMTAHGIGAGYYYYDSLEINETIKSAQFNSDLVYIIAIDETGNIINEVNKDTALKYGSLDSAQAVYISPKKEIYQIMTPIVIERELIGRLYLGFSMEPLREEVEDIRAMVAMVSLIIFVLGIFVIHRVDTIITRPLIKIVDAANQIAGGDISKRAMVYSKNEIGELATAFNAMVKKLSETQQELENANQHLEDRIVQRTQALYEEIEDRKRAEESLAKSISVLTSTLESTGDGILVVDRDKGSIKANQKLFDLTSVPKDLVEKGDFGAVLEYFVRIVRYPDRLREKMAEINAEPEIGRIDILELLDNRFFEIFSQPHWEHGKCVGRVYSFRDVTEQHRLEESLRQSQKMEAIGQLAGGVAHDFNNILTIINGYGELMLATIDSDHPMYHKLVEIKKAGERASGLTGQLLAFSRKQVLAPQVLDINAIVANMQKMLKRLIGENIAMEIDGAKDLWKIHADKGQIEQVLMNLIVNARDAMPNGGVIIINAQNLEVSGTQAKDRDELKAGFYVRLAVTDTGKGMDSATQARIFEPFFTTKEVGKGTGMGLSTVYGIIKQSEGAITVQSELGKGTTFNIYLPRVTESEILNENEAIPAEDLVGNETILLVEDDKPVRELAFVALVQKGYTVLEAADAEEAIKQSEKYGDTIQLLLTDVIMPKIGGCELAGMLKNVRPSMRVLFMSGYTDNAIAEQINSCEFGAFLQKPFTPESLAKSVRNLLNSQAAPINSQSIAKTPVA
jgi:signal transduction histidine kinase/HAMP domain-containing protein/ActR/RegA family two-component response regulator